MIRPHYVALYQSICRSKKLAALPDDTCRLFFHDLLTNLDSHGRCEADAATLNAAVWPMLDKSREETERAIQALAEVGLIVLYEVDGARFLFDPTWEQHGGKVGRLERRGQSLWPDPNSERATRCGTSPARARARIRSDPIRTISDPIRSEIGTPPRAEPSPTPEVETWAKTFADFPTLDRPECHAAYRRWLEYRRTSKLKAWPAATLKGSLGKFEPHGPAAWCAQIGESISNGWQGLFPPRGGVANGSPVQSMRAAFASQGAARSAPQEVGHDDVR